MLFHKLLYVGQNEETSCLKLVHFYDDEGGVPSEMEANWKSEPFPCQPLTQKTDVLTRTA